MANGRACELRSMQGANVCEVRYNLEPCRGEREIPGVRLTTVPAGVGQVSSPVMNQRWLSAKPVSSNAVKFLVNKQPEKWAYPGGGNGAGRRAGWSTQLACPSHSWTLPKSAPRSRPLVAAVAPALRGARNFPPSNPVTSCDASAKIQTSRGYWLHRIKGGLSVQGFGTATLR
jgi:hypothetical protein